VGLDQGWHHAPARQIAALLKGAMEAGTSDGPKRQWSAGPAVLKVPAAVVPAHIYRFNLAQEEW
jgi:quercetin dioxygenase-like cupin family protein